MSTLIDARCLECAPASLPTCCCAQWYGMSNSYLMVMLRRFAFSIGYDGDDGLIAYDEDHLESNLRTYPR